LLPFKDYNLYQDDIIEKIITDEKVFKRCMIGNYHLIASNFGYDVNLSDDRLGEAWIHWKDDLDRVNLGSTPEETVELDHFKQASFLCFWLRRLIPLGHMFLNPEPTPGVSEISETQKWFAMYGNELCATRIGVFLCHGYEIKKLQSIINEANENHVQELKTRRRALINLQPMSSRLEIDMVTNLKHKNNSPHSINLIFRALFSQFDTETR